MRHSHRSFIRVALVAVLAALSVACGGDASDDAASAGWEHTRATEDGVTTVRTLSGSRWGGPAQLVEELSIGMLEGPDEYTFGGVTGLWVAGDRILVGDSRLSAVRVYDAEGRHVLDVGAQGQGPGEYESVGGVVGLPDGRIVVHDGRKLLVYDAEGEYLEQWGESTGGFSFFGPDMLAVDHRGTVYMRRPIMPDEASAMFTDLRWVMQPMGADATDAEPLEAPDLGYEPATVDLTVGDGRIRFPVPFAPGEHWSMLPGGGFVAGVSDDYRFEIRRPGGEKLVVEKAYTPVPVDPDEVELQKRTRRMVINGRTPEIDWSGIEIPEHKPAYDGFVVSRDERILVLTSGPVRVDPACLEPGLTQADLQMMDCTEGARGVDVFEVDGTFLGSFRLPDDVNLGRAAFVSGDHVWASAQDENGTVTVKKLRIVTPGARSET